MKNPKEYLMELKKIYRKKYYMKYMMLFYHAIQVKKKSFRASTTCVAQVHYCSCVACTAGLWLSTWFPFHPLRQFPQDYA